MTTVAHQSDGAYTFARQVAVKKITKSKVVKAGPEQLVDAVVYGMEEVKAHDIVVMDLRKVPNALSDYFVVCHGTSNTQVQAIADSVEKETFRILQDEPAHSEGGRNATWILMDYVNVIVHIFSKDARDFYALEDLWADASVKRIEN
ncbi:MAG: ribosome silencing factor [Flavobacteriales bacterium]